MMLGLSIPLYNEADSVTEVVASIHAELQQAEIQRHRIQEEQHAQEQKRLELQSSETQARQRAELTSRNLDEAVQQLEQEDKRINEHLESLTTLYAIPQPAEATCPVRTLSIWFAFAPRRRRGWAGRVLLPDRALSKVRTYRDWNDGWRRRPQVLQKNWGCSQIALVWRPKRPS